MKRFSRTLNISLSVVAIASALSLTTQLVRAKDPSRALAKPTAVRLPSVGTQVKIETFSDQDADAIARVGFEFVRFGVWTDRLGDAAYVRRVARAFSIADGARLPVLLTVRSTVPLGAEGEARPAQMEVAGRQFGAQINALTQKYGKQLIGIELWNEPDMSRYWPTGQPAETFPPFVRGLCAQIDASRVPVYGFGFARAPVGRNDASKLLQSALSEAPKCIQAVSYHAYGMTPAQVGDAAREVRSHYGLPTMITEWGVPSQGSSTSSLPNQAHRFGTFVASVDALDVSLVSIYEWKDTERAASARERSFGLVDANGAAKPALDSVTAYFSRRPGAR